MKVNEILKRILKDGWYLYRHGANHDVYRHPTKSGQVIVPRYGAKELRKGTEINILKEAGLK
ncbi:type II toxin-antitoxin system HicA family toxin [Capnocytophaga sp. ARDL2]|uniref:type II toxin-antitoxin system HicA family toxin n=1 Tax=Capnocytophaga sp. ARDL2 TaxID=3238809 RepID=UPI0035572B75